MADDRFIYVTYIRTTQEKVWNALKEPEFTRQYFFGVTVESKWTPDSAWRMVHPDGKVTDSGKVVEIDPPRRLVLSWRNEFKPELTAEGYSRATFELETQGDMVKLTVVHEIAKQGSKLIEAVSGGWPIILSSLKSLLETGKPLERSQSK
ncbi:MAG TPA: SRPBCC family protein [Micropepsaceae bacterium]|jgi:uncharacterized protein YndB with AHSA1/START domain